MTVEEREYGHDARNEVSTLWDVMNYHAEKINYLAALTNPEAIDPDLGGIVEEVHTCPGCGNTETRQAEGAEEGV